MAWDSLPAVRTFLSDMRRAGTALVTAGLLETPEIVLTAGGSAYFDVVADELGGVQCAGLPALTLLRSGCYVTHDHGLYQSRTPFNRINGELRPALRVWASVISRPEPELALVAMETRHPLRRGTSSPADRTAAGRVWSAAVPRLASHPHK